jgi:outer membrane lipoprotein SlyB
MDAIEPTAKKLHPLVATAAVAVIVTSVLGAIVLISDQVAAHRGADTPTVASADTASSATPSPPAAAAAPHRPAHSAPKSNPQVASAEAAPPPPPPGAVPAVPPDVAVAAPPLPPVCKDCGTVAGVRAVKTPGEGTGVGAVAGGVVGGVVGHQFGSGHGKDAMSILGVIGGAVAGHEVEKEVKATTRYVVDVRLDNGQLRTVSVPGNPGPIVGSRVRIENGQLVREAPPQS